MVSRYTRFRVLLPDSSPRPHSDTPCGLNGLASMLPKGGVLYGFRITRIACFLTGCARGFSRPYCLGSRHGCRSWRFARRYGGAILAPYGYHNRFRASALRRSGLLIGVSASAMAASWPSVARACRGWTGFVAPGRSLSAKHLAGGRCSVDALSQGVQLGACFRAVAERRAGRFAVAVPCEQLAGRQTLRQEVSPLNDLLNPLTA
jgi:hypothetical protein